MKTLFSACTAWSLAAALVLAQTTPPLPSNNRIYGTNPASLPGDLARPSSIIAPPANGTVTGGNATAPSPINNYATSANNAATAPNTGRTSSVPALTIPMAGDAGTARPAAPVLQVPSSMELVDNQHLLAPRDQIIYQVLEDRDNPSILFVDEGGNVTIPYLGRRHVQGQTLRQIVDALKVDLEKPENDLYFHATVLAAPYAGERGRGQVVVYGQVIRPGAFSVPPNDLLSLFGAIQLAGGFTGLADQEHLIITRPDPAERSQPLQHQVDFTKLLAMGKIDDEIVQPGDFVNVPSKNDTSGYVTITGEVRAPGLLPLPAGTKLKLSEAIIRSGGFTEWADHDVTIWRWDKDGKRTVTIVDVDQILNKGLREKDVDLQTGDLLKATQSFFKFGN